MDMKDIDKINALLDNAFGIDKEMENLIEDLVSKYGRFDLSEDDIEEGVYPVSVSPYLRHGIEEIRVTSVYKINDDIVMDGYDDCGDMIQEIYNYGDFNGEILDFIHYVLLTKGN